MQSRKRPFADQHDFNTTIDFSQSPRSKRQQQHQLSNASSTTDILVGPPLYEWPLFAGQAGSSNITAPPSTMSPSSMYLGQTVDHLEYSQIPSEIDQVIASVSNPTPQDKERYPGAATNIQEFNQEIFSLQNPLTQDIAPHFRQTNEPWTQFNSAMIQSGMPRRYSGTECTQSLRYGMPSHFNTQTGQLNPTANVTKAHSESQFPLPDSGYASAATTHYSHFAPTTQSVISGDFGNSRQECRSIANGLDGLEIQSQSTDVFQAQSTELVPYDPWMDDTLQIVSPASQDLSQETPQLEMEVTGPPWICQFQGCDHPPLKNKSDYKKHKLRHDRPFKCTVRICDRLIKNQGFSTQNDLDRHLKSVHKAAPRKNDRTYICKAPGCRSPKKVWPRADNFKQHCTRLHPELNLEQLVEQSLVSSIDAGYKLLIDGVIVE